MNFKTNKEKGNAGLGFAIAYFSKKTFDKFLILIDNKHIKKRLITPKKKHKNTKEEIK